MRLQPNRNYVSNDDIQTPPELARRLVEHFQPTGHILEPCAGDGNFLRALRAHVRAAKQEMADRGGATEREARRWSARGLRQALARSAAKGDSRRAPLGDEGHKSSAGTKKCASRVSWCEVKRNRDFLAWDRPVDWIVTNPPWSEIRSFLQHALSLADHVVFLFTINHLWTRARLRDLKTAGFGLREIVMMDTPPTFPPMGFQLGAVHLSRGWTGPVTLTDWNEPAAPVDGGAPGGRSAVGQSDGGQWNGRSSGDPDQTLEELRALNRHLDTLLAEAAKP